ncbi:MAG: class I SAM-dependent methyltransferase [Candidatus Nanoarchaeia archaeon]
MFGLKVKLQDAEKAKKKIIEEDVLDQNYVLEKTKEYLIFPLKRKPKFKGKEFELVEKEFQKKDKIPAKDLKVLLKDKLSAEEFESLKTSFDAVGTIAILEIDDDLRKKEKIIAEALLESNPNIKTVLRKDDKHGGEFRTQKMVWLAGEKTKETIHKENGVLLKLNVETVYFSARLSTERKRIAELVKPGEEILVMFSGCAPYVCVLAKNTPAKNVLGIEINPEGQKYGLENLKLNKIKNAELICGDVKKEAPKLNRTFDRILMPLPKSAGDFLDSALLLSKKGTIIHFYYFLPEDQFAEAERLVDEACKRAGKKWKKITLVKCGQHAPRVFRICLDFQVLE